MDIPEDKLSLGCVAGYRAAAAMLSGLPVTVFNPGVLRTAGLTDDPFSIIAVASDAYTVEAVVLPEGINLCRTGRFGFSAGYQMVDYPVPHDAGDFAERLAEVLLPAVHEQLALARAEEISDRAEHGPDAAYETRDAIRPLDN
jgi:hypothetical protein